MNLSLTPLNPHALINSLTHSLNSQVLCTLIILEGQYLIRYQKDNQTLTQFISSEAVRNAFSELPIDSGFLSPGIVRIGSHQKAQWIVKFIPPSRHNSLTLENRSNFQILSIPLPGLVLIGVNQQYYLWAIKSKLFDPQSQAYNAPFPNINPFNGRICFGANPVPIALATTINDVWNLFIKAPFNGDSVSGKSRQFPQDIRRQWENLTNTKSYPLRDLIAISDSKNSKRKVTIAEVIECLIQP